MDLQKNRTGGVPHGQPVLVNFQKARRFFRNIRLPYGRGGDRPDVPLPFINIGSLFTTHTDTYSRLSHIVTEKETAQGAITWGSVNPTQNQQVPKLRYGGMPHGHPVSPASPKRCFEAPAWMGGETKEAKWMLSLRRFSGPGNIRWRKGSRDGSSRS